MDVRARSQRCRPGEPVAQKFVERGERFGRAAAAVAAAPGRALTRRAGPVRRRSPVQSAARNRTSRPTPASPAPRASTSRRLQRRIFSLPADVRGHRASVEQLPRPGHHPEVAPVRGTLARSCRRRRDMPGHQGSRPAMARSRVDFPQPDGPSSAATRSLCANRPAQLVVTTSAP